MSKDKNLDKNIDLKNYDDPSGVSLKEMNFGLWLAENRHKILRVITATLIIICVVLFIYLSYNLVIYFVSDDLNLTGEVPMSPRQITTDLVISPLEVFSAGERYDFASKIANPNDKFMATFDYCFALSGKDIACGRGFILPGEEKYILALGQEMPGSRSDLTFRVSDIFWERINAHNIPDWNSFASGHLNFPIQDLNFSSGNNDRSEKIGLNSLTFSIKNDTPYGYYDVPLNILLYSGQRLVGVNRYDLQNFTAGENRSVKLSWTGQISSVDRTEIRPDLNIMANDQYQKYQGENVK